MGTEGGSRDQNLNHNSPCHLRDVQPSNRQSEEPSFAKYATIKLLRTERAPIKDRSSHGHRNEEARFPAGQACKAANRFRVGNRGMPSVTNDVGIAGR
jgi:hypothetical protein